MLEEDKIIIYRKLDISNDEDLYKGFVKDIPPEISELKIGRIWARKKDVLEIRAE